MSRFFIVGAQRSGTTYLWHALDHHPEICMASPVRPEPKFFMQEELWQKGKDYYERAYFSECRASAHCFGEKSTSYIESPTVAERIRTFYPDAKIIMILRDPVKRALSNYQFSVAHGLEELDFGAALAAEPERLATRQFSTSVSPYAYKKRGIYADYVDMYFSVFGRNQVRVLIFEEFSGNMAAAHELYDWLGVDASFCPPTMGTVFNNSSTRAEVAGEVLKGLAGHFESSLPRLENLLGRSLDVWRKRWSAL